MLGTRSLAVAGTLALTAIACGTDNDSGPVGGPVAGLQDAHCSEATHIDLSTCHETVTATTFHNGVIHEEDDEDPNADYGPTVYNSEADDDDCKYHVTYTSTAIREDKNVTFTVKLVNKETGLAMPDAKADAEIFLNDTHPAPNSDQKTKESPAGTYEIGPVQFDAAGTWTVRFHFFHDCQDTTEDSPHGHVAFYVDVP